MRHAFFREIRILYSKMTIYEAWAELAPYGFGFVCCPLLACIVLVVMILASLIAMPM
jgi:hypothetical protein